MQRRGGIIMRNSGLAGAFLAAACLLLGASVLMAAPNPPAEVLQAAESGLPEFLVKIPLPEMCRVGSALIIKNNDLRA